MIGNRIFELDKLKRASSLARDLRPTLLGVKFAGVDVALLEKEDVQRLLELALIGRFDALRRYQHSGEIVVEAGK